MGIGQGGLTLGYGNVGWQWSLEGPAAQHCTNKLGFRSEDVAETAKSHPTWAATVVYDGFDRSNIFPIAMWIYFTSDI